MTVVLGGGITGLSAAFYAAEKRLGSLTLIESSDRLGGWIRSKQTPNGNIFEMGPRTVRIPNTESARNTLNLIDRLDLKDKLIPITVSHPTSRFRMIYVNNKLHPLPTSLSGICKKMEPFDRPLINALWNDFRSPKVTNEDESLYSFVERRLGKDIADNLVSAMVCGITAGDAKKVSVNFLMPSLFEAEQKHGSIMKGLLMKRLKKLFSRKERPALEKTQKTEESGVKSDLSSAALAAKESWCVWGLEGGLEILPRRLAERVKSEGVEIRMNERCEKITFLPDCVELEVKKKTRTCSKVISALPANNLAPLLERQHPQLARELAAIPMVTVGVVNLEFPGQCLPFEAFGFLVPPKEKVPILGVIFDSCVFPSETSTVLTVMMGGAWFQEYFGASPTKEYLLSVALDQVKKILGIKDAPISHNVAILKDCIPQQIVGHNRRLFRIQNYISAHKLPLALCGSSYEGVGLNDVILSAKQAVDNISEEQSSHSTKL